MEELEQALKKYDMGDEKTIKEIIAEVDADHVSLFYVHIHIYYISYSAFWAASSLRKWKLLEIKHFANKKPGGFLVGKLN